MFIRLDLVRVSMVKRKIIIKPAVYDIGIINHGFIYQKWNQIPVYSTFKKHKTILSVDNFNVNFCFCFLICWKFCLKRWHLLTHHYFLPFLYICTLWWYFIFLLLLLRSSLPQYIWMMASKQSLAMMWIINVKFSWLFHTINRIRLIFLIIHISNIQVYFDKKYLKNFR